jgi:hypothetical protein
MMALSGAVDLVSTDRNRLDRRRSERKTFRRNPLAATLSQPKLITPYPQM